jgi:hypothetical protein
MPVIKRPALSPHQHAKAVAKAEAKPALQNLALMEALKQLDAVVCQEQAMMGYSFWRCYGHANLDSQASPMSSQGIQA